MKYLVIDSNEVFAKSLDIQLEGVNFNDNSFAKCWINPKNCNEIKDVFTLCENIDESTIILINIEAEIGANNSRQEYKLLELFYHLRCRKRLNPIVFYGFSSMQRVLQKSTENLIIASPGCTYLTLPFEKGELKRIKEVQPLKKLDDIKPFIKPKVDEIVGNVRHRIANYSAMALMLEMAEKVHPNDNNPPPNLSDLNAFKLSLDYSILRSYFNLEGDYSIQSNEINKFKLTGSKKILLVDDYGEKGWTYVLGRILYGNTTTGIYSVKISTKDKKLDVETTCSMLNELVSTIKPHLILLDLRLCDEEGDQNLHGLGGFKLLKKIKSKYKGIPVVIFSATKNSENVKELLTAGAKAIWTKPGFDEELSKNELKNRYCELIKFVQSIGEPNNSILNQFNDSYNPSYDISKVDFDLARKVFFEHLDFLKYRLYLNSDRFTTLMPREYNEADAIYIDSNIFLSTGKEFSFWKLLASVVKLSIMTKDSGTTFISGYEQPLPKVVIMNSVYDEIIKWSKKGYLSVDRDENTNEIVKTSLTFKRAPISQLVIKDLFSNGFVRAELTRNYKGQIEYPLENPKENVYADGYILDEISNLIVAKKYKERKIYFIEPKVMLISGDNGLIDKFKALRSSYTDYFLAINREKFVEDMSFDL